MDTYEVSADVAGVGVVGLAVAALHSPSTGIVDSHGYLQALLGEAESHGARLVPRTRVREGRLLSDGRVELTLDGEEPMRLRTPRFVNAAGLWAPRVTAGIDGLPAPPSLCRRSNRPGCSGDSSL